MRTNKLLLFTVLKPKRIKIKMLLIKLREVSSLSRGLLLSTSAEGSIVGRMLPHEAAGCDGKSFSPTEPAVQSPSSSEKRREGMGALGLGLAALMRVAERRLVPEFAAKKRVRLSPFVVTAKQYWQKNQIGAALRKGLHSR